MKKFYAIAGIIAGVLIILGGVFTGVGIAAGADKSFDIFDNVGINIGLPEAKNMEYTKLKDFNSIDVSANLARIEIVKSDKKEYAVEYKLYSENPVCEVNNGKLVIKENKSNNGFNFVFPKFNKYSDSYIRIYVPEGRLDSVKLDTDMGSVRVNGIESRYFDTDCDMGEVVYEDVKAEDMNIYADMGRVVFYGSITGRITAELDMGSAELKGYLDCDMDLDCSMGSVDITTYYSKDSYEYDIDTDMGSSSFDGKGGMQSDTVHKVKIDCDMGSVSMKFEEP